MSRQSLHGRTCGVSRRKLLRDLGFPTDQLLQVEQALNKILWDFDWPGGLQANFLMSF
ncbi:MAG: hypothetical protein QNK19_12255 [Xanthomonadales bacterium]|nr:hypothetical protein [Xanthomonadales bacterium]